MLFGFTETHQMSEFSVKVGPHIIFTKAKASVISLNYDKCGINHRRLKIEDRRENRTTLA
jgi:hypothetical protein